MPGGGDIIVSSLPVEVIGFPDVIDLPADSTPEAQQDVANGDLFVGNGS